METLERRRKGNDLEEVDLKDLLQNGKTWVQNWQRQQNPFEVIIIIASAPGEGRRAKGREISA